MCHGLQRMKRRRWRVRPRLRNSRDAVSTGEDSGPCLVSLWPARGDWYADCVASGRVECGKGIDDETGGVAAVATVGTMKLRLGRPEAVTSRSLRGAKQIETESSVQRPEIAVGDFASESDRGAQHGVRRRRTRSGPGNPKNGQGVAGDAARSSRPGRHRGAEERVRTRARRLPASPLDSICPGHVDPSRIDVVPGAPAVPRPRGCR